MSILYLVDCLHCLQLHVRGPDRMHHRRRSSVIELVRLHNDDTFSICCGLLCVCHLVTQCLSGCLHDSYYWSITLSSFPSGLTIHSTTSRRYMSKQTNAANPPRSMVTHPDTSPPLNNTLPRHRETDVGANRPNDTQMNEGRVSGEQLEGSTLGSSSRDGERGAQGQRRTQNSSSFLLDSAFIPRSKSLRASQHRPHRSEPNRGRERRGPPEVEHTGSRKTGRLPWSCHRNSVEASSSEAGGTGPGSSTVREDPQPSDIAHLDERDDEEAQEEPNRASVGLDQDSIQIVNLALNLSESRRRGNLGRSASHRVASSVHYADSHAPIAVGVVAGNRGLSQTQRSFRQSLLDDSPRQPDFHAQQPPANRPLPVSSLLPNAVDDTFLPQDISESTLARVAKARRHFELFGEYLRLLPSLPPLRSHNPGASANGDAGSSRAYNPLQTIRNRKVRYREKCPIIIEVEGWHDLTAVHEWVDTVGQQYGQQARDPVECIRLPHLRQDHSTSIDDPEDAELLAAVSPPNNMKQAKRSSSKTRRPRFDWLVPPAELLADAAWVEDDLNKSKVVDKDGNSIYPDPAELVVSDANDTANIRKTSLSGKRMSLDVPSRASFTYSPRGRPYDHAGLGRGRPRHRLRSPSSGVHSSSVSTKDRIVKQRGSIIRSRSSSSISDGVGLSERSGVSSPLSARMTDLDDTKTKPAQGLDSPLYRPKRVPAWANHEHKRASMSSAASTDDRHNRMSLDAMRSIAPNSPLYPGFFPSITADLSPQSSRSPSPTKKRFSRKIGPHHERAKSKNHPAEARDSLDSEFLRKRNAPSQPDATDRPGNLEPSPLADQAPSAQDEQAMDDTAGAGRSSGQYESKLRGMFKGKGKKGKGKLASLVGTEVSKVGDFILKKDHSTHSRQSSFATSATSDDAGADAVNNGKTSVPKSLLRRLPTLSDDSGRISRKDGEQDASKSNMPSISTLASPSKQNDNEEQRMASDLESARENVSRAQDAKQPQKPDDVGSAQQGKFNPDVSVGDPNETFGIGPSLRIVQEQNKKRQIKDPSVPFSLTRPPVTGLAQAEASPPASAQEKRPTLSGTWTISDRSIPTLADLGIFEKREIERTRALLLSSGIKAREITRRAETVRDPAPEFLQNSADSEDAPIPRVTRLREFDLAAQNLRRRFERSQIQFQQSMNRFPTETASPLKTKLDVLENLVSQSLAPRVRAAGSDAESLSIQLNTTSTLALKQLSDTLDKGVRMRRRRLRRVRRAGFVMLEWALVGMLWWVWLLVMAFKVLRSAFRGAVSGIRWVLWL